jgi:predicted metal-binding membrane protein
MTAAQPTLARVLRRDRVVVLSALGIVALLAWAYLVLGAGVRMDVAPMAMEAASWTPRYAGVMFAMWALMMVAMMLPGAAPMILLFAAISRRGHPGAAALRRTAAFGFAYVCVWAIFAAVATGLQWELTRMMLLSPALTVDSPMVSGALFVAAGIYQLLPIKQACLRHCRAPTEFLARHWRAGTTGALRMGLRHGLLCVGCCWMLMGLLFVGGIMNLLWIAALALIVFIEKAIPQGKLAGRVLAAGLVAWGATVLMFA